MLAPLAFAAMLTIAAAPLPKSTPAAERMIALDLRVYGDARQLAAHPGLATRTGKTLRVGDIRFVDEGECDGSGCERYRFDRVWPGGYAGILFERDESSDYWMVRAPGDATAIGAAPIASPKGTRLFVGFLDENSGSSATDLPSGIAIWSIGPTGLERIRLLDPPVVAFDRFIAWHGDACVEFSGTRADGPVSPEPRHFWLVEEKLDWTLHDARPAACPPG